MEDRTCLRPGRNRGAQRKIATLLAATLVWLTSIGATAPCATDQSKGGSTVSEFSNIEPVSSCWIETDCQRGDVRHIVTSIEVPTAKALLQSLKARVKMNGDLSDVMGADPYASKDGKLECFQYEDGSQACSISSKGTNAVLVQTPSCE